jgi:PEP-CTERM motif-containing protein
MKRLLLCLANLAITGSAKAFIVCSVLLATQVSSVNAGTILPKDANLFVQQEAMVSQLSLVGSLIGDDPGSPLRWSGTIRDTDWSFVIAPPSTAGAPPNNYRDGLLQMNYTGSLDRTPDLITWTGEGSFTNASGSVAWNESGSYTNATADGFWSSIKHFVVKAIHHPVATILDISIGGAQVAAAFAAGPLTLAAGAAIVAASAVTVVGVTTSDHNNDQGITVSKEPIALALGTVDSTAKQSAALPPFMPPFPISAPGLILDPNPGYPAIQVTSHGEVMGDYRNVGVDVKGAAIVSAVPVPEPGSLALFAIGCVGLLGYACRHRKPWA